MLRPTAVLIPVTLLLALCCMPGCADTAESDGGPPEALPERWARAVELHNLGFAALENEQPAEAERAYRELARLRSLDPLPWANLAVALLRQQKTTEALEAIDTGIERLEGLTGEAGALRGRLHAIRGAILDWEGRAPDALDANRKAADGAPDEPEIQYTLYRQAVSLGEDTIADRALERLMELRPENFVVLVERTKRAIQDGNRQAASAATVRIRELLWQAPPIAQTALDAVVDALESAGTEGKPPLAQAARVPAARLENVLKVTPMYRESLRELSTGIQAVPVRRFATEPPPMELGDPLDVTFAGERLSEVPTVGGALVVDDLDGDGTADTARILDREPVGLEVRASSDAEPRPVLAAPGATRLLAADLFNDGGVDLLAHGGGAPAFWNGTAAKGDAQGPVISYAPVELAELGLEKAAGRAAAVLDFDIEGDLDLVVAGKELQLYRNSLEGPLEAVGARVFPKIGAFGARDATTVDLDRDGDTDLVLAGEGGLLWLDNLRHGRFADRTAEAGLDEAPAAEAVVTADLDNDGMPEIVTGGDGITVWANRIETGRGGFERVSVGGLPGSGTLHDLAALDLDNDGRLDLATAGADGVAAYGQTATTSGIGSFRTLPVEGGPIAAHAVDGADLDGDGDLDLVAAGPDGLHSLTNRGGDENGWLAVRLRGLVQGNSKNNLRGVGSSVEVKVGTVTQFREHDGEASHFGLGRQEEAEVVRVVWTNGVPQDRVEVARNQRIVEEQVLKGSCPFLYTYTGGEADGDGGIGFVTDLLWNAPAGLPVAPGVYAPADPDELVEVGGAQSLPGRPGVYDLRITEELWEAAYFDHVRLWVVDHPADVEVASNLRIVPGGPAPDGDRVLAVRDVRPVVAALDGIGRDVTARVAARDHVYADGYRRGTYQGLADEPWTFTFDLGPEAAARPGGGPARLLLDGWIFPTDASLNLAIAQRDDLAPQPPRLEVETEDGWRVLMPNMGHPAGKTKTMVVDTPPLPEGARRLRIVTNLWISWDRVAWSPEPIDGRGDRPGAGVRVTGRLVPEEAELRFRGFSRPVRRAPNAPHEFDYARVSRRSPWTPTPGPYTKYGDVLELLAAPDDRSVILAAGDEVRLLFDASDLAAPPAGWERTLFLESHGWDKDFDRNTWAAESGSLPLPFHGMGTYGPSMEEKEAPDLGDYRERWLTRTWPGPPDRAADGRGEETAESPARADTGD